jgi:hypothetical protein
MLLDALRFRWAAMNPPCTEDDENGYAGSEPLDAALADRFALVVEMPAWAQFTPEQQLAVIQAQDTAITAEDARYLQDVMARGAQILNGLGDGFEILALKSTLDGFTSVAFAATMGWGVAFSAIPVGLWQGLLTILSATLGNVLSQAAVASITATGGILLLGTGLRVLQIRMVSVSDLLPALVFAPVITLVLATTLGQ